VPPAAGVLATAPAGLVITGNWDEGCSGGSATFCTRQIFVRGPAGLPGPQVARMVADQLARGSGWQLTYSAGQWQGGRLQGWLLDRHQVCVTVAAGQHTATLTAQTTDSW
jgi:hypothetical protein